MISKKKLSFTIFMIIVFILCVSLQSVQSQSVTKKLIAYGWGSPYPEFFRQNIQEMEKLPFDGVIIKLNAGKEVFRKTPYPEAAFTKDRDELANTNTSKLTNNFVLMWSTMEDGWDWFNDSDWSAAAENIRNFTMTGKVANFKGIAFDPEKYGETENTHGNSPWNYTTQPNKNTKTFEEYQQQVRKRGAQFATLLQETQPGVEVLTLGLLSWMKGLVAQTTDVNELQALLTNADYGLWPAFINGMLDVASSNISIIDGNEGAYYFYRDWWFDGIYKIIKKDLLALVDSANHSKYEKHVKIAQSVYVDILLNFSKDTSHLAHLLSSDNQLRLLEHNVYHALRTADEYVWIHSEDINFWQNDTFKNVEDTIQSAKSKIAKGEPLGFNLEPVVDQAINNCKVSDTDSVKC